MFKDISDPSAAVWQIALLFDKVSPRSEWRLRVLAPCAMEPAQMPTPAAPAQASFLGQACFHRGQSRGPSTGAAGGPIFWGPLWNEKQGSTFWGLWRITYKYYKCINTHKYIRLISTVRPKRAAQGVARWPPAIARETRRFPAEAPI